MLRSTVFAFILAMSLAAPLRAVSVRSYATLLAAASKHFDPKGALDQPADPYMTLVGYFNSLRELGGTLVLMLDDVNQTLRVLSQRRGEKQRKFDVPTELTSRRRASEIPDILQMLEEKHAGEDGACDVLLATNMISVGVDVKRFGLMVVHGQPKSMAEYIQATSRVGRGKVPGLVVSVLNRPRHEQLIADIREAWAGTRLMSDGDVAGGINAARHNARTDMCVGVGGSPEGIVTACAIKALGGHIQGRLWPRDDDEKQRGVDAGLKLDGHVYEADDLVTGSNTIFVATGVTDGQLVDGVRREGGYVYTESVVLRGASGTLRRITSEHLVSKWL